MNALEQQVWELITAGVRDMNLRLVRVRLMGAEHYPTLQIMIEPEEASAENPVSVTVDECEAVSRMASALLDVEDIIDSRYQLEVSSTGVERPFVTRDDFTHYAGARAKVKLVAPVDGQFRFTGTLEGMVDDDVALTVTDSEQTVRLPFTNIRSAHRIFTEQELQQMIKG